MKETMLQYIKETPEQCRKNIRNSELLTKTAVDAFCAKKFRRIQIVASGSSFNGAQTAKYFMEKCLKMKVEIVTSFATLNYETVLDEETFYMGMGQSGRSTNTNAAMEKIRAAGISILGVSGNADSEMKNHCTAICEWGVGIEKIGYVTKGYSTSVLFCLLFALEAGKRTGTVSEPEYRQLKDELLTMTGCMDQMITQAEAWYQVNETALYDNLNRIQITGYGPHLGVAMEGALKIEETMARGSTAYEMEEYLHGPFYETNAQRTVIVIDGGGPSSDRAVKLYRALHKLTSSVFLITYREDRTASEVLSVPQPVSEFLRTLVNVIPFQIIAAHGRDKWGNPEEEKYNAFGEEMNTKSPRTGKEVGL